MPETTVAGRRVHWREAGEGAGRPVLLAHCSLAHSGLWKPVMAALPGRRTLAPDMPAHGRSEPPPEGVSLQAHAVAACRTIAEAEGGPLHLVGLSLGGAVLGRLAVAEPGLCASLTLIEPVFFHLLRETDPDAFAANEATMEEVTPAIAAGDYRAGARAFMEGWGMQGKFDSMDEAGQAHAARCLRHLGRDFDMVTGTPPGQVTLEDLAGLTMPVMLVSGETTQPPAAALCDLVHAAIPGARRAVVPGAGHLSPVSHPEVVTALLREFWGKT